MSSSLKSIILKLIRALSAVRLRGKGCHIGEESIVNGMPYVRRKGNGRIIIGDGVTINSTPWANWLGTPGSMVLSVEDGAILEFKPGSGVSNSHIIANVEITIGEDSMIGAGCLLCDSDMHEVPLNSDRQVAMAPIRVGKNVFIGARSIILKGVTIGDGAVIGAGSVVTKDVPAGMMACGNPVKIFEIPS